MDIWYFERNDHLRSANSDRGVHGIDKADLDHKGSTGGKDRVTVLSPTTVAVAGVPPSLNVQVYTDWNVASTPGWAVNVIGTPGTIPGGAVTVSW